MEKLLFSHPPDGILVPEIRQFYWLGNPGLSIAKTACVKENGEVKKHARAHLAYLSKAESSDIYWHIK